LEHVADGLAWLPEDGVTLSRVDLERIFIALRALVANTEPFDPNRSHVVEIAATVSEAIERDSGGA
jgi:hypothetical protein